MRQVLLLRGINLGAVNRISMPALRELLSSAGLADVRTYLQSGNVVVSSEASPQELARECEARIAEEFGFEVDVLARSGEELAAVVARDPFAGVAKDPKRYQVSFCAAEPDTAIVERVSELAAPGERLLAVGRELYAWHPDGVARSKLSSALAGRRLGVLATARNWATVTALHSMAGEA